MDDDDKLELDGPLDFQFVQNNNSAVDIYITRKNSKLPLDLTGCRIIWQLFDGGEPVIAKDSNNGPGEITIFDQTQSQNIGRMRVFLVPADSVDIEPNRYFIHDSVVIDGAGNVLNVRVNDELLTEGRAWIARQHAVQP